ncbi:MAG: amidophosphoribosyltransferase [Lachnospiraceae bacterium]|jgi:amidophosphoribosyltransferase|nr:amidophosphoribosyltransferase [Lachnospiraceae bacterium]
MSGFFGIAAKTNCVLDLFFGTDYHSHLGTRRAGMAVYSAEKGYDRAIHNIENTPFRTKFEREAITMEGNIGIGCISDYEPQPLIIRSHHGTYAIMTVGRINNAAAVTDIIFADGRSHFLEMSGGGINPSEMVAAIINQKDGIVEGISYAQTIIEGSMTIVVMTEEGIYAARDRYGRTPVSIGRRHDSYCISFESFAYLNLGFVAERELGPGEIVFITAEEARTMSPPGQDMQICAFLWIYYGYSSSSYEGIGVEETRYRCGCLLAEHDGVAYNNAAYVKAANYNLPFDNVIGVPDSGVAHAIGYSNASGIPFSRALIKYTPTWPRSFLSAVANERYLIAKMKLIPVRDLIRNKKLLIIDDSIVRGTQLKETTEFLKSMGAKEIHARAACPPLLYSCKFHNFSRSDSVMDLISRQVIHEMGNDEAGVYTDPDSECHREMVDRIRLRMGFDSLSYQRLDDMVAAIGLGKEKLCTYCWTGCEKQR